MGIRYVCSQCGYLLYEYKIEKGKAKVYPSVFKKYTGVASPSEIIAFYGGKCPRCGKKLKLPTWEDITISLAR